MGESRVAQQSCLRLLEPVALAVQLQNMDMMREAIEQRAHRSYGFRLIDSTLKGIHTALRSR